MSHFNQIINFAQIQNNPPNLFWEFSPKQSPNRSSSTTTSEEGEVEVELNLSLSLGGIYSSNAKEKPLLRSSSSAVAGDGEPDNRHRHCRSSSLSLSRSCSVPAETNREALKRSMAAKRRASPATEGSSEIATGAAASAAKSVALGRAIDRIKTQSFQKMEGRNNVSLKSSLKKQLPTNSELGQNRLKKARASGEKVLANWADVMNRMPSVTTTGDGPDGKRVDGFLYKYTKGQVSIVCVCHGRFLTPTEFVCHAGGKEVDNPMRHINVCSSLPL